MIIEVFYPICAQILLILDNNSVRTIAVHTKVRLDKSGTFEYATIFLYFMIIEVTLSKTKIVTLSNY